MTPTLVYARLWRAATKNEQQYLDAETLLAAVELIKAGQMMRDAHQKQFEWALQWGEARLTCCEDAANAWDAATVKGDDK